MKTFYIQVVTEKEIDNTLTVEEHRTVPTHYLKLMEYETKMVRVDYKPGSESFDEKAFRQLMLSSIKKRYQKIVKVEVMDGLPHLE